MHTTGSGLCSVQCRPSIRATYQESTLSTVYNRPFWQVPVYRWWILRLAWCNFPVMLRLFGHLVYKPRSKWIGDTYVDELSCFCCAFEQRIAVRLLESDNCNPSRVSTSNGPSHEHPLQINDLSLVMCSLVNVDMDGDALHFDIVLGSARQKVSSDF